MRTLTASAALVAAVSLAACQPAADGTETASADAAEDAASEASASGDMVEARLREGLWQTSMTADGSPAIVSRMCMDATMTALDAGQANQAQTEDCTQTTTRTADGFDFTSRCDLGGGGVTETQGSLTGDFQTAYRMEATVTTTGATAMNGSSTIVTEAAYQGACPEGWRPGDVEIPGLGARINVNDMREQAMQSMPPATPPAN